MKEMICNVNNKLEEYGIKIFKQHHAEDNQYVFFTPDIIIFIYPDKSLNLIFQAITKPENVARYVIILYEIPNIKINIMESFIYNKSNDILFGEEAYKLINDTIKNIGKEEYLKEETYTELLRNVDCFEC